MRQVVSLGAPGVLGFLGERSATSMGFSVIPGTLNLLSGGPTLWTSDSERWMNCSNEQISQPYRSSVGPTGQEVFCCKR